MKPYLSSRFEDPLDGPDPTKQTKWRGGKRRAMKKRRARVFKKGIRQQNQQGLLDAA